MTLVDPVEVMWGGDTRGRDRVNYTVVAFVSHSSGAVHLSSLRATHAHGVCSPKLELMGQVVFSFPKQLRSSWGPSVLWR